LAIERHRLPEHDEGIIVALQNLATAQATAGKLEQAAVTSANATEECLIAYGENSNPHVFAQLLQV